MKKFLTSLALCLMLVVCFTMTACSSKVKAEKVDNVVIAQIEYGIATNSDTLADSIDGVINGTDGIANAVKKCLRGETHGLEVTNITVNHYNNIATTDLANNLIVVVMDKDDVYSSVKNSSTADNIIYTGRDIVIAQAIADKLGKTGIAVVEAGNSLAEVAEEVKSVKYLGKDVIGINCFELKPYTETIYDINMVSYYKNADHYLVINKDLYKSNMTVSDIETLIKGSNQVAYVDAVAQTYIASLGVETAKTVNLTNATSQELANYIKNGQISVAVVPTAMAGSVVDMVNAKNTNWSTYVMIGVIVLLLGFWIISSQRNKKKKAKEAEQTMSKFQKGCYVKTIGGVMGKVVSINENEGTFVVQTGSGATASYMKFDKQAIYQISEGKKTDAKADEVVEEQVTEPAPETENKDN